MPSDMSVSLSVSTVDYFRRRYIQVLTYLLIRESPQTLRLWKQNQSVSRPSQISMVPDVFQLKVDYFAKIIGALYNAI